LRLALESRVGRIVVDSFDELDRIEKMVDDGLPAPDVLLRVTPGVEAHTHEFVAPGQDDSKFGFTLSTGAAEQAVMQAGASTRMTLRGIHIHIGSQVFRSQSYADAFEAIAGFSANDRFEELSIGGGLGVAYVDGETAPSITEWATTIQSAAKEWGIRSRISAEPGRAITASAAVTLYTVGTIKDIPGIRTYVAVDGGMSDNPRPMLYGSGYETFLPRDVRAQRPRTVRVVGKHCETGDVIVYDGLLPADVVVGDLIATPVTGAYGHSMGSNYNKVLRPAVVFVSGGESRLVVRRETYEDLLTTDVG
jgi:diaminopimelate decarboxylase